MTQILQQPGATTHLRQLRIHGDNILECEHALRLLARALESNIELLPGTIYAPTYRIQADTAEFQVQLFPGYGCWDFDLPKFFASKGAPLREATDAVITELTTTETEPIEAPILSFEFCNALPAGNNAWQRSGRALAMAMSGIPYIYYAEVGGIEMGKDRDPKASRFPNPIVPYAYLSAGGEQSIVIPVFLESPSANEEIVATFKDCFGYESSLTLIRALILGEDSAATLIDLRHKAATMIRGLAERRSRNDVLAPQEWDQLMAIKDGAQKAQWMVEKQMKHKKKISLKSLTNTFPAFLRITETLGHSITSSSMPLCLIAKNSRRDFAKQVQALYQHKVSGEFIAWLADDSKNLACVMIAGFKPRGDDSRPDRGLVPLPRMIFGKDNVDMLSIIYGPATPDTWEKLSADRHALARSNGLWEAVVELSDAMLVDSPTAGALASVGFLKENAPTEQKDFPLLAASITPRFGEHHVDTTLHMLFSHSTNSTVHEAICNPPGGDWSGLNLLDFASGTQFRWTSLPRVSASEAKRPDHVVQLDAGNILLILESKNTQSSLEEAIGPRLVRYVTELTHKPANVIRDSSDARWRVNSSKPYAKNYTAIAGAAFQFTNEENLLRSLKTAEVDISFGIEFSRDQHPTVLHIAVTPQGKAVLPHVQALIASLFGMIAIDVHEDRN